MKHGTIIKKINELFLNSWTVSKLRLDSSEEVKDKTPYISLNYQPKSTKQKFLSYDPQTFKNSGYLRIFIYETNPTTSMILLDEVIEFLKDKELNGLKFTELEGIGSPTREKQNELYSSFIDFEACLI
jgi:hypothetical protein